MVSTFEKNLTKPLKKCVEDFLDECIAKNTS